MKKIRIHFPHARLSTYLAVGYMLLIAYASLSPFSGWREQGVEFSDVLSLPLMQQYSWFDVAANLFAYLPLGLLLGLTLHTHFGAIGSVILSTLGGMVLSVAMEYAQMYLPVRISSNLDLLINSSGTLLGALMAVGIAPRAWFAQHLIHWRLRFFHGGGTMDFGLALVLLWIFAQINPSLPMLGNVFISKAVLPQFPDAVSTPFRWLEVVAVALNLMMMGMLLLTLLRKQSQVVSLLILLLSLVALAKFIAAAVLLKSWALLLWLNSEAMLGIFAGALLLAVAVRLPRIWVLWCAALITLAYLVLTNWIVEGGAPSIAMPLYQWNYGHLLNYNGLSQSIALILPFLLLGYFWHLRRSKKYSVD